MLIFQRRKFRSKLCSVPRYVRPYCNVLRKGFGGLGLYLGISSILAFFWYCTFQKSNLQVFGIVICFQLLVIGWASGWLRILTYLFETLHANMVVHMITGIYLVQTLFLIFQIDENSVVVRIIISYIVSSLIYPYLILQIPLSKRNFLFRAYFWSTVIQTTLLSGATSYFIQFLLQNPCSPMLGTEHGPMPGYCFQTIRNSLGLTGDLNLLFLNDFAFIKLSTLFVFQALAYHVASLEESARSVRPISITERRYG